MRTLAALLTLAAAASAQDKRELKWSLKEGDRRPATWKLTMKSETVAGARTESADVSNISSGKLAVVSLLRDGRVECLLTLTSVEMKVKQGAADVHIAVADGAVEKAEGKGAEEAARSLAKSSSVPITLTLSPTGECSFTPGDNLGKSLADIEGVFGPRLPGEAVAPGGTWKVRLTPSGVPRAAKQWGFKPVDATCTFKETVSIDGQERVRIVLDGSYDAQMRGVKGKHELSGEAFFDAAKGRLTRSHVRWKTAGRGEKDGQSASYDMDVTVEFTLGD
jgi:hypothetical protein